MPLDASPITISPAVIERPSMMAFFFNNADRKASEIIFAARIHARHFRRFSANQRTTGLFATGCNSVDDGRRHLDIELSARKIVEEEQRLCAERQNIVDTHRD